MSSLDSASGPSAASPSASVPTQVPTDTNARGSDEIEVIELLAAAKKSDIPEESERDRDSTKTLHQSKACDQVSFKIMQSRLGRWDGKLCYILAANMVDIC